MKIDSSEIQRIVKAMYKKQGRLGEFEKGYLKMNSSVLQILNSINFSKLQLVIGGNDPAIRRIITMLIN
jgi:hypothetical protein